MCFSIVTFELIFLVTNAHVKCDRTIESINHCYTHTSFKILALDVSGSAFRRGFPRAQVG